MALEHAALRLAARGVCGVEPAQYLDVSSTQLEGTLSATFAAWSRLQSLRLFGTQLSGTLHPDFSAWRALQDLRASSSPISGTLDPTFSAWSLLQSLRLRATLVSGRERLLQGRRCISCPDLPVRCSALAVLDPPHVVTRSVYPFMPRGALNRSLLPHLSGDTLLPCLHPAVCGGGGRSPFIGDNWTRWGRVASSGAAFTAEFSQFQCRDGHDPATPLCAGCVDGYWLDGFLCQPCFAGARVLVVLGMLAAVAVLACAVWRHHRAAEGAPTTSA
jgi:hypothetical protein